MLKPAFTALALLALSAPTAFAADDSKGYWEYRLTDPATNVAVLALIVFLGIVWYAGGFKTVGKLLDKRGEAIRAELEEARRLREEAQILLSDSERRQRDAALEADEIIRQAKEEAISLRERAEKEMADREARREAQLSGRIARAEAEAADRVRAAIASVALSAARDVMVEQTRANDGADQFEASLAEIEAALSS